MVNVAFSRPARSSSGTPSTRMPISYSWSTIQNPCPFTRSNSASNCTRSVSVYGVNARSGLRAKYSSRSPSSSQASQTRPPAVQYIGTREPGRIDNEATWL
ncbi:hypothetical protein D3C77_571520 [compost metagenome]